MWNAKDSRNGVVAWLLARNTEGDEPMCGELCQGGPFSELGRVGLEDMDPRGSSNGHQAKYPQVSH